MGIEDRGAKKTASANIVFLFCISAPLLSRSSSLRSDHIAIVIIETMSTVEQPPVYLLLEALHPLASNLSQRLTPRDEVDDQASVEVADRDGGVVQLRHDGRLPLQVLGDAGVDLVKCHHLQSFACSD